MNKSARPRPIAREWVPDKPYGLSGMTAGALANAYPASSAAHIALYWSSPSECSG